MWWVCALVWGGRAGVKYHWNEEAFCSHMRGFVPHTTDKCHTQCLHAPQPQKTTPHLHLVNDAAVVDALRAFIKGYLDDQQCYLHGFNTNQIKSLNGLAAK
jgi:hypothetical protein